MTSGLSDVVDDTAGGLGTGCATDEDFCGDGDGRSEEEGSEGVFEERLGCSADDGRAGLGVTSAEEDGCSKAEDCVS
jgi:hypothetical protein